MKSIKPKISVIIPVYNGQNYIADCINSLITQDCPEVEIICVDDCSSDFTNIVLQKFASLDSRIRIFRQYNEGVSATRNRGISEARGEYVCFIDADDYLSQGFFKNILNTINKQNPDLIIFGGTTFPQKVLWAETHLHPRKRIYTNDCWRVLFDENASKPFVFNKVFKKELLLNNNICFDKNIKIGEDQAFMFDFIPLCKKIVCTNKLFYNYRIHSDSAMSNVNFDLHNKVSEHKKFVAHVVQTWLQNNWCNKKSIQLFVDWIINVFKKDIELLGLDFKKKLCKFIIEEIEQICDINSLKNETKSYLLNLREILNTVWYPLISVIIPVYNASSYLEETIACLLKQTFTNFELIFVDDGSTDNSLRLLERLARYDFRVKVLKQSHKYAGAARNLGLKYAQGEYVIFLDSDDYFAPEMLEKAYARIKETDAEICVFRADRLNQVTKIKSGMEWTCRPERCKLDSNKCFSKDTNPKHVFDFTITAPWNKLFKKSFILENNLEFQNTRSANDMAFILTALAIAKKITAMDDELLTYRVNNNKSLQGSQDKYPEAFFDAIIELKARLIKYGVYETVKDAFINFALDFCFYNLGTLTSPRAYEKIHYLIINQALDFIEAKDKPQEYFYTYLPNKIYEKLVDIQNLSLIDYASKWNVNIVEQTELYRKYVKHKTSLKMSYKKYNLRKILNKNFLQHTMSSTLKMVKIIGFSGTVKYAIKKVTS